MKNAKGKALRLPSASAVQSAFLVHSHDVRFALQGPSQVQQAPNVAQHLFTAKASLDKNTSEPASITTTANAFIVERNIVPPVYSVDF